ncbi:MAG: hypothetical protein OEW34_09650 [Burkholderiaceae bacterium]|nr:hypothetical protein [Burkholderiaceae bacterium]
MAHVDSVAALAISAFMLVGFALMLFMLLVQPIWCLIDCAVDRRRSGGGKAVWIIVLVVLYGIANWFYGAFAAGGRWLRRMTWLAWIFAILLVLVFLAMYNMREDFRRGIDQEWQRGRDLVVMTSGAGIRT